MKTYKVIARPDIRYAYAGLMPLTEDVLGQALAGVAVRKLSETHWGQSVVDVQLQRPTDGQALDEIEFVLQQLGFSFVEATISKWGSEAAEKAIVGGVGGFVLGGGIAENLVVGLITSAIGTFIGHQLGAAVREVVAEYEARRDYRGTWVFREIPQPGPAAPGFQPGFSPT